MRIAAILLALSAIMGCNGQSSGYMGTGKATPPQNYLTVFVRSNQNLSGIVLIYDVSNPASPIVYGGTVNPLGSLVVNIGPPIPTVVQVFTPTWSRSYSKGPDYLDHLTVTYP